MWIIGIFLDGFGLILFVISFVTIAMVTISRWVSVGQGVIGVMIGLVGLIAMVGLALFILLMALPHFIPSLVLTLIYFILAFLPHFLLIPLPFSPFPPLHFYYFPPQ